MPPRANRGASKIKPTEALRAAVGGSLSKAEPSDAIRDPAKDVEDLMEVDDGLFVLSASNSVIRL